MTRFRNAYASHGACEDERRRDPATSWRATCPSGRPGVFSTLLVSTLLMTACHREPPKPTGVSSVAWKLTFDTARTTPESTGWRVTTDAGYDVHVTQAALTTWRLSLTKCPEKGPATAWSLIPAAYANHVEAPDPASILPHLTENLAQPAAQQIGPKTVPTAQYCQGYWLASPPPPAQSGDLPRTSLRLHATWQKADKRGELNLETWMPDAKMQEVPGLPAANGAATIRVTRYLGGMLDGIDLANAPTPAMAWTVLHNLMRETEWVVEAR